MIEIWAAAVVMGGSGCDWRVVVGRCVLGCVFCCVFGCVLRNYGHVYNMCPAIHVDDYVFLLCKARCSRHSTVCNAHHVHSCTALVLFHTAHDGALCYALHAACITAPPIVVGHTHAHLLCMFANERHIRLYVVAACSCCNRRVCVFGGQQGFLCVVDHCVQNAALCSMCKIYL